MVQDRLGLQEVTQFTYDLTFQCVHVTVVVSKSNKCEIYWICFVEIFMQQAKRMRIITFSSVARLPLCRIFYIISNSENFSKILKENVLLEFFFYFCYCKKNWRTTMIYKNMPFKKYPTCLSDCKGSFFLHRLFRNLKLFNFKHFNEWFSSCCNQKDRYDRANTLT